MQLHGLTEQLKRAIQGRKWFVRGQEHAGKGLYVDACQAFAKAADLHPSPGVFAHWALALNNLKDFNDALAKIQRARQAAPANPAYQLFEALVRLDQGDFSTSSSLIEPLVKKHPQNRLAQNLAALSQLRQGNSIAGVDSLEYHGLCGNLDVRARLMLELQLVIPDQQPDNAGIESQGPMDEPKPGCCRFMDWLRAKLAQDRALRLLQKNRAADAVGLLQYAGSLYPGLSGWGYHRGVALFQLQQFSKAREELEKVDPGDFFAGPACFYLALCNHRLGHYEQVETSLLNLEGRQDLYDFQEYLYYFLGLNYLKREDLHKALACFRRALDRWSPLLEELLSDAMKIRRETGLASRAFRENNMSDERESEEATPVEPEESETPREAAASGSVPAAAAALQSETPAGAEPLPGAPLQDAAAAEFAKIVPRPLPGVACIERDDSFTERFYLLQHPETQACLRLDNRDRFLWRQMDGSTSLNDIAERYCLKFGSLGLDRIGSLYQRLLSEKFIEPAPQRTRFRASADLEEEGLGQWIRNARDLLAFRFLGPELKDGVFLALYRLAGFLPVGAPVLFVLLPVLGVIGFVNFLLSLHANGTGGDYHLFQPSGYYSVALLALYVWNLIGSAAHELARALALKARHCRVLRAGPVMRFGLLGAFVDIQDYQKLPRRFRLTLLGVGMVAELFFGGLCGFAAAQTAPSLARDLLGLGSLVFGIRLFFHVCPLFRLDLYLVAAESSRMPHLRQAALRFLQPRYWLKIWTKDKWAREELLFLAFGLWCVVWLTAAAQIASFIFRTQLFETAFDLLARALSPQPKFSSDEAVAFLIILMVLVPALLFLVLTIIYLFSSVLRVIPQMKIWKKPTVLVGTFAALSFVVGYVTLWLPKLVEAASILLPLDFLFSAQRGLLPVRGLQTALWVTVSVGGAVMAASLLAITRRETERLVTSRLAGALNLGTVAVLLGLFGALVQSSTRDSWPYLTASGAIVCVPAILFMLRSLFSTFSTPLFMPWLAMTGAIAVFIAAGVEALYAALIPASMSAATFRKLPVEAWLGQILASGWLFLTMGCGWWFLVRTREPVLPRYPHGEGKSDKELLIHGFSYLLSTMLVNLRAYGGRSFANRLREDLMSKARELGLPLQDDSSFLPDPAISESMDFDSVATRLKQVVGIATDSGMKVAGTRGLANLLHSIYTHLPWDERELVNTQLFQGTRWAATLGPGRAMPKSDRLELLRTTFLFHQYAEEELGRIASIVRSRIVKPLELIIQQDEIGEEAYVIQRGRVQVQIEDAIGETHIVAELGPGDFFGEMALLEDAPRSATVQAIEEVEVLVIDRAVFNRFVEYYGGAREKLAEAMRALRVIQKMPLFEEFSAGEMVTVASKFHLERFPAGQNVVTQGEVGDRFYIIQSGSAEVLVNRGDERQKVRTLRSGEFFGEIALLHDVPRTASVRSLDPMVVFSLHKKDFLELLSGNPFAIRKLRRESGRRVEDIERRTQKRAVAAGTEPRT